MSMLGGVPKGRADAVGETVARYSEYEAAQKAVSRLIAAEVPARDIAIVGIGLRSIERITGKLGYATAARSGAINGLLLGLLFSAFLVFGSQSVPIQAFIGVMFVGIALGMLLSILAYSFVRRRRDFASSMQVIADHYDVTVAAATIHKARQVLGVVGAPPETPHAEPAAPVPSPSPGPAPDPPAEPPRFGERIAPAPPAEEADAGAAAGTGEAAPPVDEADVSPGGEPQSGSDDTARP
jgi:hypothetical protein